MKIKLEESTPGEFRLADPDEVLRKARTGLKAALVEATGTDFSECCGPEMFSKAMPRGGEMQVVEDLAKSMANLYTERMERLQEELLAEVDAAIIEGVEP